MFERTGPVHVQDLQTAVYKHSIAFYCRSRDTLFYYYTLFSYFFILLLLLYLFIYLFIYY